MHWLLPRIGSFGASLGILAALASCAGSDLTLPSDTAPANISKIEGDNQTGAAGAPLTDSLAVKVVDRRGTPVADQRVAFIVDPGAPGAQVSPDTAKTRSDGMARARWVLGATGGTQTVVARVVGVNGLEVTFGASVAAGDARSIAEVSGNNQTGVVGTALADPLVVVVTDQFGNPVAGVQVTWAAQGGTVDPSVSMTGADGRAQTSWILGSSTGTQSAAASSQDLTGSPVAFTGTAVAGSADNLLRVSGDNQSAPAGTELSQPIVVRLVDRNGNGISNRPVSWVVGVGGGSVASTTSTTDGNGLGQARWTLGPTPGTNTLNAVVSGVGVVGFTATATSGGSAPSRLAFRVQPSDSREDKKISPPVEVVVLDAAGIRFTDRDIEIKLELTGSDNGELGGDRTKRTSSGIATFPDLKVKHAGEYRLHATADGLPAVDSDRFQVQRRGGDEGD